VPPVDTDLLTRLRDRGWRLSAQRRAVAEVLAGEHVHLSAEEVRSRAGRRLPEISRATVYNTLNELVALGEVLEIVVTDGPKRYDPNVHTPHDHLVCARCGAIRDVPASGAGRPVVAGADLAGYAVTHVEIVYRGLCPTCASLASSEAATG